MILAFMLFGSIPRLLSGKIRTPRKMYILIAIDVIIVIPVILATPKSDLIISIIISLTLLCLIFKKELEGNVDQEENGCTDCKGKFNPEKTKERLGAVNNLFITIKKNIKYILVTLIALCIYVTLYESIFITIPSLKRQISSMQYKISSLENDFDRQYEIKELRDDLSKIKLRLIGIESEINVHEMRISDLEDNY